MPIAAQVEKAACRGHRGTHFVPVPIGDGHWVYYWLSLSQFWFWRSRSAGEKAELARKGRSECFVCSLQSVLESDALYQGGP